MRAIKKKKSLKKRGKKKQYGDHSPAIHSPTPLRSQKTSSYHHPPALQGLRSTSTCLNQHTQPHEQLNICEHLNSAGGYQHDSGRRRKKKGKQNRNNTKRIYPSFREKFVCNNEQISSDVTNSTQEETQIHCTNWETPRTNNVADDLRSIIHNSLHQLVERDEQLQRNIPRFSRIGKFLLQFCYRLTKADGERSTRNPM